MKMSNAWHVEIISVALTCFTLLLHGSSVRAETVKASSFGFDPVDATKCLQAAINSGAAEVIVDKMPSPWIVSPIKGRSNLKLVFEPGVEVKAKKGEFMDGGENLFNFAGRCNVTLVGPGAVLSMNKADYQKPPYTRSEHRHLLNFGSGCRNIIIDGLELRSSGGDGIYIGAGHYGYCSNVVVRNVTVDGHFRQGMSVISVDDMLIENCRFVNTKGTPPAAGIDFEPNFRTHRISRVTVRKCLFDNNEGAGINFFLYGLNSHSHKTSVVVEDCLSRNNACGFNFCGNSQDGDGVLGSIVCRNCTLDGNRGAGYAYTKGSGKCMDIVFENCRVRPEGGATFKTITQADLAAHTSCPVFVNGTANIPEQKTDFSAAKPIDTCPGEMVKFLPGMRARYNGKYVFYADKARKVRFIVKSSKIQAPKFHPPTAPFKVETLDGKPVAEIPMPPPSDETEISCEVPAAGFYRIRGAYDVGGLLAFCGADVPFAFDTTRGWQSLLAPRGKLYIEMLSETDDAVLYIKGGGPAENISVKLVSPSGKIAWQKGMVGVDHRFQFMKPRETGLWTIEVGRPDKGHCEDAGVKTIGAIPNCFFLTPEKRWTWQ